MLALRADSVPTAEIASRLGIEAKTVAALENSAARSRAMAAEGCRTILFPPELIEALRPHAQRRGISANTLARRLIEVVLESELVDAVLDDGVTGRGFINVGAPVHVRILGSAHPPIMVTVGEVPE
ncbi:MAG TPA: hypothetical protein VHY10_05225 [Xanthobacteraceae bacterium]|nr:hypothetical protein [Xanthobacteraceae bacterium]